MPDNPTHMADGSNHAAERNSVADAEMKHSEFTFIFQLDLAANSRVGVTDQFVPPVVPGVLIGVGSPRRSAR